MKQQNKDSNFADWDLSLPKTHNRVAAFEAQQKKETAKSAGKVAKATTNTQNPYLRARLEVLTKYKEWRRNEIQEMERTGNIDNKFYDDFVREVALLGDTFMPLC